MKSNSKKYSMLLAAVFMAVLVLGANYAHAAILDGKWKISEMLPLDGMIYSQKEVDYVRNHIGFDVDINGRNLDFFYKSCVISKAQKEILKDATLSKSGHYEDNWSRLGLKADADAPASYNVVSVDIYCPGTAKVSQEQKDKINVERIPPEDRKGFLSDKHTILIGNSGQRVLLSIKGLWVVLQKTGQTQDVVVDPENQN